MAYLTSEEMSLQEILKGQYLRMKFKQVQRRSRVNLLDNLKRWFLAEKTYELVFEGFRWEANRIYHPAELNMFTENDFIKTMKTSPVGKREWNAHILEMIVSIDDNLIKRFPMQQVQDVQAEKVKEKEKSKKKKTSKKMS